MFMDLPCTPRGSPCEFSGARSPVLAVLANANYIQFALELRLILMFDHSALQSEITATNTKTNPTSSAVAPVVTHELSAKS